MGDQLTRRLSPVRVGYESRDRAATADGPSSSGRNFPDQQGETLPVGGDRRDRVGVLGVEFAQSHDSAGGGESPRSVGCQMSRL
jgi:hypothetical protein